jgi:type III secretion protein J
MSPPLRSHRRSGRAGFRRAALAWVSSALLCACQMDLNTKATEADANEMLGALLSAGLDAHKRTPDAGKTWTITVDETEAVQAINVLRMNALPRERRATLGELFKKEGLISSPTEERVRFIYGIEQELAETVSKVDGVMVARVHIVLPNNDPLATAVKPSSASVFVKHRAKADVQTLVPAIKNLVVHAVEGLGYEQVTLTLVPSMEAERIAAPGVSRAGPAAAPARGVSWVLPAGIGTLLLLALTAGAVYRFKPALLPGWLRGARPGEPERSAGAGPEAA